MNSYSKQPSIKFWIISVIAILWNLLGVFAYLGQAFMNQDIISTLSKPEQNYFNNLPVWVTAAFATAVFSGVFGAVSLLFKKKIALLLFVVSLIGLCTQQIFNFFIQDYMKISGLNLILPIATTIIGVFLVWYTFRMNKRGLLN